MSTTRRRVAALVLATAAAAAPVLATAPAAAATPASVPADGSTACETALAYGASASADLLRLHALDLPGVDLGPLVDVRVASTGAGMAAEDEIAAAAAGRDIAANLIGLDLVGLLPVGGGLGHTVYQEAPPSHPEPATSPGIPLELGLVRAGLGGASAHAAWQEAMACGAATGPAGSASASLLDAAVLPAAGGQALVALPDNLASRSDTGLVEIDGDAAARASAAASLTDLRLLAGSESEIAVRVVSEPELVATATGRPGGSQVDYHAPLLEISGPGIGTARLDSPGTHLDVPLSGTADPLPELLAGVDTGLLSQLQVGSGATGRAIELPGLLGLQDTGPVPTGDATVLRLSLGTLEESVTDQAVSAAAASLRVQLLTGGGTVLDLGVGLLEVAASAPALPEVPSGGGGGCGVDCPQPGPGLPVTGSVLEVLVGAGVLLLVAGRFLLLATRRWSGPVNPAKG